MDQLGIVILSASGLLVAGFYVRMLLRATKEPGTAPASEEEDRALGTMPQVRGILAREAKEPGTVRAFLRVMRDNDGDVDRYAALMGHESGFDPAIKNSIGAVGLMQWHPKWVGAIGETTESLAKMTAIEQLTGPVVKTMKLQGKAGRRDPAMAGWGSHVGEPPETVIARAGEKAYEQNKGFDRDKKGFITVGDVQLDVYKLLDEAKSKPRLAANGRPVS